MPVSISSLALLLAGLLAGIALVGYGGLKLRTVFHILRNDPISVRELAYHSGPVEVTGVAVVDGEGTTEESGQTGDGAETDGKTVVAPFSGTECLAYRYEVEEYRQSGKNSYWKTLDEGGTGVPFLVDDGGDLVPVDPAGADLRLTAHVTKVDAGDEPPEHVERFVAGSPDVYPNDRTIDLKLFELNVGNPQRFTERRLDVGEEVYVYGTVRRPDEVPAWGSDRVDAEIAADDGGPFVVSDTSERKTALRLAWGPLAMAGGGLLVVLFVVWFALGSF